MSTYDSDQILVSDIQSSITHTGRAKLLQKAKMDSQRPPGVPTAIQHARRMDELDKERFELLKQISEAEMKLSESSAQLTKLKEERKTLEARDVVDEVGLDGSA